MTIEALPSRRLTGSDGLGWRRVHAAVYDDPAEAEAFATRVPELLLVLVTDGRYRIESRHGRTWHRAAYRPGSIGVTAPGNRSELRWRATGTEPMRSLHLRLDPALLPGTGAVPDALAVDDPYVTASARALHDALGTGAPGLYADAVAQGLVAHLAHRVTATAPSPGEATPLGTADRDLIVDYMRAHLADDVSLDELAALVNLSKYHFLRTFARTTGLTPHRYLSRLRLDAAAELLRGGTLPVQRVALICGYASPSRFATAFQRAYGCTPTAYRRN
ncbi:AraC family transcriptional regulator [Catenuloplanes nepalensis]|uniref:AraC family transcriptional regulator n=1 Tax=Catenuloplanes nepalensis TaxID=587533 RepID=A0ABT9MMY0_9ACTN|nr:AraC family transcriptional regulator [Catenuloplanes nepalensis]MDP9792745.1 AraC family transcriptional regulator [Catenuloplanes nepalensis]